MNDQPEKRRYTGGGAAEIATFGDWDLIQAMLDYATEGPRSLTHEQIVLGMPEALQAVFYVMKFHYRHFNGGLSYFFNGEFDYVPNVISAFEFIEAPEHAKLIRDAYSIAFATLAVIVKEDCFWSPDTLIGSEPFLTQLEEIEGRFDLLRPCPQEALGSVHEFLMMRKAATRCTAAKKVLASLS